MVVGFAYLFAHSFWQFAAAAALMGAFRGLDSGPLEAWFVDVVHEESPGADVDQELSRAGTEMAAAMAAGALLSGALIWWYPVRAFPAIDLSVATFAVLNIVHLAATLTFLKEGPRRLAENERGRRVRESIVLAPRVIGSGLRMLTRNRVLLGLIVAEIAWSTGMVAFESLMPLRLEELLGGSAQAAGALIGPVAALGWGMFALGTWLADKASKRWGVARAAMLGRFLNALGVLLMSIALSPAGLLAAYLFTYTWHGLNRVPHAALLHREADASNRSTILSINSMFAFLAFGVAGLLAGLLADSTTIATAMLAVGVVSMLGVAAYVPPGEPSWAVRRDADLCRPCGALTLTVGRAGAAGRSPRPTSHSVRHCPSLVPFTLLPAPCGAAVLPWHCRLPSTVFAEICAAGPVLRLTWTSPSTVTPFTITWPPLVSWMLPSTRPPSTLTDWKPSPWMLPSTTTLVASSEAP